MITLLIGIAFAVLGIRILLGVMGFIGSLSLFFIGLVVIAAIVAVIGVVFKLIFTAVPILLLVAAFLLIRRLLVGKSTV